VIRRLAEGDIAKIRALAARCHPTRRVYPPEWYIAYPTLVGVQNRLLVAYTAFAVGPSPDGKAVACYGQDVGVSPEHRGKGWGAKLHAERVRIAQAVGATVFLGMTQPDNHAMIRIFERAGLKPYHTVPGGYVDETPPRDAVIWIGPIRSEP
jgi:GNAT superfamily N-acetyltransferase